ncbi:MAG: hypothetical protein HY901_05705 [Deltaproteobacteria bacterium]|nr:hypothetical protein [Deltaproteobacteria bacterium]
MSIASEGGHIQMLRGKPENWEATRGAASAPLKPGYVRREPEKTVLHEAVRTHLETFLAELREDELCLPRTVGSIREQAVGRLKARRRRGSEYLGSHQIASLNLANISRFHVHPMFRAFLAMKEAKTQAAGGV